MVIAVRRTDFALGVADLRAAAVEARCRCNVGKDDGRLDVVRNGDAKRSPQP